MPDDPNAPLDSLVDMGRAVGELGVALAEAQWRIDQGTLDVAASMTEWARPAFSHLPADPNGKDLAQQYAQDRTVFYSMPEVRIRLESSVRIARTRGGLVQTLLGIGSNRSNTQETAAYVEVTMVAVPMTEAHQSLMEVRTLEQQGSVLRFLREHGFLGEFRPQALRKYGLTPEEVPAGIAPTGRWNEAPWMQLLLAFKKVWNQDLRAASEETFVHLPEHPRPDRLTLSVLESFVEAQAGPVRPEALEGQARMLLSALCNSDEMRSRTARFPRSGWGGSGWEEAHRKAIQKLKPQLTGFPNVPDVSPAPTPSPASIAFLRIAWERGLRFDL